MLLKGLWWNYTQGSRIGSQKRVWFKQCAWSGRNRSCYPLRSLWRNSRWSGCLSNWGEILSLSLWGQARYSVAILGTVSPRTKWPYPKCHVAQYAISLVTLFASFAFSKKDFGWCFNLPGWLGICLFLFVLLGNFFFPLHTEMCY